MSGTDGETQHTIERDNRVEPAIFHSYDTSLRVSTMGPNVSKIYQVQTAQSAEDLVDQAIMIHGAIGAPICTTDGLKTYHSSTAMSPPDGGESLRHG